MKNIIINKIENIIDVNFGVTLTAQDINNIYYMLVGKVDYVLDNINDGLIIYIIETYFDNDKYIK